MNELVAILEAALSGDPLRAIELAEQAGLSRFDIRRLTGLIEASSDEDDENGTYEDGYKDGYEEAVSDATSAVEDLQAPTREERKAAS